MAASNRCVPWLVCLLLGAASLVPSSASAQLDDWQVRRDPFDKSVIARYKGILARRPHDDGALAKLRELYRRHRSVELLVSEYQAQVDKDPTSWATLIVLGKLARSTGDETGALALLERAVAAKGDDATGWLLVGDLRRATGRPPDARAAYERALAAGSDKPTKSKALRALADLALAAGDNEAANRAFRQFLELDPKNAQLWIEHGDAMLAAKRAQEAASSYAAAEKLLTGDPARRVEVVARRGQALEALGHDDEAKREYRRAIALAPRGYYIEVELTARIIDLHRRRQDLGGLIAEYEQQWPERTRGHFEWDTLGKLYEETGAQEKAITALRKAATKAPWELETQRRLIGLLENSGRNDEALTQFEAVVRVAPGEARFQIDLVDRYWRRGLEKKALEALRRLESRFPGDPGILGAIADLYQRYGKEDLALAAYERLAKIEPDEPSHLIALGEQYLQKGDKARALATWRRIASSKSAAALAKLGEVMAEHNEPREALAAYEKALKLEPKNPELYKGRAALHEARKDYQEALADLDEALRLLDPKDRSSRREVRRRVVSVLMRTQGKENEQRARWILAFSRRPADLEAGYFLIEYYAKRPYAGEPMRTLVAMRALAPDDQDVIVDLAKAYRAQRKYDSAVTTLLDLIKVAPHREHEVYNTIAEIKSEARLDDEAEQWAQKALAKSPNNPVAYQRIAELNVSMQRFDEAIAAYEKAIALDPRNTKSFFALAELYVQAVQPAKAIELYRRLLRSATDEEILSRAGREAIDLEEMTGTLGELERTLAPLSFMMSHKQAYRRALVDLYLRYVPTLVERTRHGGQDVRLAAQRELTRLGEHGLRPLLEALRDEKDVVQQRVAVSVLGHLANPGAALPLVNLARQESKVDPTATRRTTSVSQGLEWGLRLDALVAAGRLGAPGVLDELVPLLAHVEPGMREAAMYAVGRTGDRRALPHLQKGLDDRRDSVQVLACLGLAQLPDGKAASVAIDVVASTRRHDAVRAACAYALGAHRVESAVPALAQATVDNRGQASRLAAWALGQLADERAMPSLLRAYFSRAREDDVVLRWAIGRVIGAGLAPAPPADPRDYPMRAERFDANARVAALPGELPTAPIPDKLVVGYERVVGDALVAALSEHRDVVLTALHDLNSAERRLALGNLAPATSERSDAALERIAHRVTPSLEKLLDRDDPETRAGALLALAKASRVDGPLPSAAIERGLRDEQPAVREHALGAIAVIAHRRGSLPPGFAALLTKVLSSPAWEDRRMAALAIGRLAPPHIVELIRPALTDPSSLVREAAARAAGAAGVSGLEPLLRLSADEAASVRVEAAGALRRLPDDRARRRLAELASDPSPAVRAALR